MLRSRFVEVLLQEEALLQFASGKRAAGNQQIAQLCVVFRQTVDEGDVVGNPAVGRKDADGAVVAKVIEHVLDRLLVYLAGEIQLHAEVARLRVHDACLRHGIEQGSHRSDLAQAAEVADEGQRIEAVAKARPVTHLGLGQAEVEKVASNRRILGPDGKVQYVRYTACRDPKVRDMPVGTIDPPSVYWPTSYPKFVAVALPLSPWLATAR